MHITVHYHLGTYLAAGATSSVFLAYNFLPVLLGGNGLRDQVFCTAEYGFPFWGVRMQWVQLYNNALNVPSDATLVVREWAIALNFLSFCIFTIFCFEIFEFLICRIRGVPCRSMIARHF